MKVFVYAVTFLGYAFSSYGFILSNLKDAVLSAEHTFGGVFKNAVTAVRRVTNEFHSAFAESVDEDCIYTCKYGKLGVNV